MSKKLKYRMYGLVNYQLSGTIHAGIQFGHAVVEYCLKNKNSKSFKKWSKSDKTFIVLSGGSTNHNPQYIGSMNKHLVTLKNYGIKVKTFYEPDLGDQLTAIVFLVDERVFDKVKYPDLTDDELEEDWTLGIKGKKLGKILFLRKFLPQFKLA